jgi:membrane protein implicated in regulation of membrane protease activity
MEWLNDHAWAAWLGIAAVLGVAEMFSLDLIFLMLAVGALGGVVTGALDAPVAAQVLVALGTSLATLTLVRPALVARLHGGPTLSTGTSRLIGTQGVVTAQITPTETGRVRLSGDVWSAAPYDSHLVIEPGETVEVLEIRGATAFVHPTGDPLPPPRPLSSPDAP